MPVIQNDWQTIKARLGDKTALFALTTAQASLLLSISQQLEWEKTFRAYDYDFSDWDYLQSEVADLQRGLMMPVYVTDLIEAIDELEDLLRALQHLSGCCPDADLSNGDYYTDVVVDGVGDVPQNIIDAGYATGVSDWDGFDDYKCAISHLLINHMEQVLRQIAPYIDDTGVIIGGIGTVAGIISGLLVAAGGPIVLGILAAVGMAAGLWTLIISAGDEITEGIADKIDTNHDELACAVYQSDGLTDSISNLNDKIDELFTSAEALILKNTNLAPMLKAMYSGRYDQIDVAEKLADRGIDVESYSCVCAAYDVIAEWVYVDSADGAHHSDNRMQWKDDLEIGWNDDGGLRTFAISGSTAYWKYTGAQAATKAGESLPAGSLRFYIEHLELDWEPGPTCANAPRFYTHVEGFHAPAEGGQAEGTYTKDWTSGNEPEVASDQDIGPGATFTSGNMDHFNDNGMVHRFLIGGFIAEGS